MLGAASYAAPLPSTLILITADAAEATTNILVACLLVTVGAARAANDMIFRNGSKQTGAAQA